MASNIKTSLPAGSSDTARSDSDSASQPEPSTSHQPSTSASTSNNAPELRHQHRNPPSLYQGLSANFAHDPKVPFAVNYDQEIYLQLMAGTEGREGEGGETKKRLNKTPTQIYREEWVRRALNPAISDPRGDPSPNDFECAESQRERDRF
ncbi:hypothetical protein BJX63DRAFT_38033 [Aspergillus granulosus]|uniref:Uncharacterized protein n=1 Tax=Aspergillus granulosus TaxID=176169 RepID=A0ABR4GYV4_9EURO